MVNDPLKECQGGDKRHILDYRSAIESTRFGWWTKQIAYCSLIMGLIAVWFPWVAPIFRVFNRMALGFMWSEIIVEIPTILALGMGVSVLIACRIIQRNRTAERLACIGAILSLIGIIITAFTMDMNWPYH